MACLALSLWIAGCSATIVPPARPPRPTAVYLCDYGFHSSLLLPVSAGVWVEYLYGDWNWAALNHTGVWPAVSAGLFSSGATLARRYVYEPGRDRPVPMTTPASQARLTVDGAAARRLQLALDARWTRHADGAVYSGTPDGMYYVYVRDDDPYGALHNCNRVTADWLDRLGCRTEGVPLLSHFAVRAAGGTP